MIIRQTSARQPPLLESPATELYVAIAGLALGGAERIVLDWARRLRSPWTPHLIVLRDHPREWTVPPTLEVTRLHGDNVLERLASIGRSIARSAVPTCVCHLLTAAERHALASGGASVVPVIHNAEAGWLEPAGALGAVPQVIAVSDAAAVDIRRAWSAGTVSVIRHTPQPRQFARSVREHWRSAWRIPADATVVGMIGAVKPQKDYPFAVRLLRRMLDHEDVYLAILGGPAGRHGRDAWQAILAEMDRSGVRQRLALPGFVEDAAACLPAFDVLLNTSHYEGLSIAALEARVNGVPVVASRVGGQGELGNDALTLVDKDAPLDTWIDAVSTALRSRPQFPPWAGFPSHRVWTLAHIARFFQPDDRVLFVTANLNAGGAQRSLVHLASGLRRAGRDVEVAVAGDSTSEDFFDALTAAGVPVFRTAATRDAFDHAERIIDRVCAGRIGVVCFWNVDAKVKLLVTKALAFTDAAIIDVSPGAASFTEMQAAATFARHIAYSEDAFYERLDRLVLKYQGRAPDACAAKVVVIPNGVAVPARAKTRFDVPAGGGRVVVCGRVAPTKFIVEIVEAMALVRRSRPHAELTIFGSVEPRHAAYAADVERTAGDGMDRWVHVTDAGASAIERLSEFDVFVVLGQDQGSPNALLEAQAAGLPCIANADGGSAEIVEHERTGLIVNDRASAPLASAIERLLSDRALAARLADAGRRHVLSSFSLDLMVSRYSDLFTSVTTQATEEKTA